MHHERFGQSHHHHLGPGDMNLLTTEESRENREAENLERAISHYVEEGGRKSNLFLQKVDQILAEHRAGKISSPSLIQEMNELAERGRRNSSMLYGAINDHKKLPD